ncbi:MAG: DUF4382 domain-containing protein [Nanoarchaeota archaeon]|nr:DUF4382 domain-containing protein [Nanoarchaeota archaeon]
MKLTKNMVIIVGVLALFLLAAGCVPPKQMEEPAAGEQEGRVVFTITDAAANMSAVTSIMVTVDSVSVHSATEGWVTVSSEPQTFDLLKLKAEGSQELLADVQLKEGTYQQLRLDISKVVVVDDKGEHEAKLPSGELKIVGDLEVKANSTSTAMFDFIADESLHMTGNGEYILAPVVQLETKTDAQVEVKADQKVEVEGGNVKTKVKVGMDADGNVGVGLGIPAKANVSIAQGKVKVEGGLALGKEKQGEAMEEDNASAEAGVEVGASY